MNAFDRLLARRTAGIGLVLSALVLGVMIGTDEGFATWAGRLGRFCALLSVVGGFAAFLANHQARSRGEIRALAAVGAPPLVASRGAVLGGFSIAALGPLLAFTRAVDLTSLFPRVAAFGGNFVARGESWLETNQGILISEGGEMTRVGSSGVAPLVSDPTPRAATIVALAVAAIAFPLWATAQAAALRRAAVALGITALAVMSFHLVAAGRAPAWVLALPPSLLLIDAYALLFRRTQWS